MWPWRQGYFYRCGRLGSGYLSVLIASTFQALKQQNQKALIPFLTADYPNRTEFLRLLHGLPNAGATIIEIGIPFSDPMADGSVIQKTSAEAINQGFQLQQCLRDVSDFKAAFPKTPIVLMTYINPLIQYDMDDFLRHAQESKVDGLLIVDLPPEHHEHIVTIETDINMIRLITPTTHADRLSLIQHHASGFIYYVSVKGITGSQAPDPTVVSQHLSLIKNKIDLPMVIGFGISNADIAKDMAMISDGVVIGSSLIKPYLECAKTDYSAITQQQLAFISDIYRSINHG